MSFRLLLAQSFLELGERHAGAHCRHSSPSHAIIESYRMMMCWIGVDPFPRLYKQKRKIKEMNDPSYRSQRMRNQPTSSERRACESRSQPSRPGRPARLLEASRLSGLDQRYTTGDFCWILRLPQGATGRQTLLVGSQFL